MLVLSRGVVASNSDVEMSERSALISPGQQSAKASSGGNSIYIRYFKNCYTFIDICKSSLKIRATSHSESVDPSFHSAHLRHTTRLFSSLFIVSTFVFHLITHYLIQLNHRRFHSVCPRSQESFLRLCGVRIGPKYRDLFNRQNREISCWIHNWERKLFRPVRI